MDKNPPIAEEYGQLWAIEVCRIMAHLMYAFDSDSDWYCCAALIAAAGARFEMEMDDA